MPDVRGIRRSRLARYTLALTLTVAALASSVALLEVNQDPTYTPLIGAVAVAVIFGGLGPALLALVLGWLAALWLLVDEAGELRVGRTDDLLRWAVGLVVAIAIIGLAEALRRREVQAVQTATEAEASMQRLETFQELTADLAASVSSSDVAGALIRHGTRLVGADGAAIGLVDGDELAFEATSGLPTALERTRLPLTRDSLIVRAAREDVVFRAADREELRAFPETKRLFPSTESAIAVPLRASGEVVGSLGFLFDRRAVDDELATLAVTIAGVGEQALERARLYERERESRRALDRVLRVAPSFHADTPEDVVAAICREARRTFGSDYGVLWRLRDGRLELLHVDPAQESLSPGRAWSVEDFPGLADVVRERDVVFVPDVLEEATGEGLDLVRELGIRSSLRTPFVLGGRTELVLAISWQVVVSEPDPSTIAVVQRFADQAILALEEVERRRAEQEAARRAGETHRLQEITAALALASSPLDVSHICLEHALRSVGAEAGFVVLADPGGTSVELVSSRGLDDHELELWQSFGLDDDVPFARAMAGGEAIWAVGPEELARFTAVESPAAASATIPLATPAGMHGALHLVFREPTEVDHAQRFWLQAAVSQCAQALERSRLFEREQLLRGRAERLQAMTGELSNALTRADVAEVAVDELGEALEADRAVLYVVDADREALRALAWRGVESDAAASLEVPLQSSSPASRAVARRRTEVAASEAELVRSLPELGAREPWLVGSASGLFVPLVVGRRSSGVVGLVWDEPRTVPGDELRFAESLAGQAAQALDRASHFESEQTIAETLQRSVLPVALPRVEGVQLAARYLPGTAELDVGGDWFDAVQLRDGRLALVVGDVVGKGVYAAASMGQLRNALRAFSIDRLKPSSVLGRLNRLADEALETTFATLVYVAVDPETRVVRYATAGHPPPVAVYPDDRVELLEDGRGLPLGTGMKTKYKQAVVELPVGALLLLYSDGLVERRGQSIDEGLEELLAVVREAPREPERLLDHVLDAMVGTAERGDDIALLAARVLGVAPKPLELGISSRTGSLDVVRDALRVWLDSAGVKRTDAEDIILATWEACANAIEHALEPAAELVHVTASYEDSTVRVTIADSGRWAPFADRPGRGLGLRLMEALMTDVRVDSKDGGTRVTVEKRLDGAELTGPRRAR